MHQSTRIFALVMVLASCATMTPEQKLAKERHRATTQYYNTMLVVEEALSAVRGSFNQTKDISTWNFFTKMNKIEELGNQVLGVGALFHSIIPPSHLKDVHDLKSQELLLFAQVVKDMGDFQDGGEINPKLEKMQTLNKKYWAELRKFVNGQMQ